MLLVLCRNNTNGDVSLMAIMRPTARPPSSKGIWLSPNGGYGRQRKIAHVNDDAVFIPSFRDLSWTHICSMWAPARRRVRRERRGQSECAASRRVGAGPELSCRAYGVTYPSSQQGVGEEPRMNIAREHALAQRREHNVVELRPSSSTAPHGYVRS